MLSEVFVAFSSIVLKHDPETYYHKLTSILQPNYVYLPHPMEFEAVSVLSSVEVFKKMLYAIQSSIEITLPPMVELLELH